jgi:acyl carrier protein
MKDMNEITTKVIELAAKQVGVAPEQVTRETHFINDLGYDSLDEIEFAMAIEDAFDIKVDDEQAQDIKTVDQAIEHVKKQLEEPAGKR